MNIFNVRFGFATNSSSTHSIVRIPSGISVSDDDVSCAEFGWQDFVCSSTRSKQMYIASQLRQHFIHQEDTDSVDWDYFKFLIGISEKDFKTALGGYVDHQSVISFPRTFSGHGLDIKFFKDFVSWVLNPDVAIIGGNDNRNDEHPLRKVCSELKQPFFLDYGRDEVVARWDEKYHYWTLFNRSSGTKVRFSFDANHKVPKKSEVPELIDIKITDKCFAMCPFCYQGSTPDGKESDTTYLYHLTDILSDNRVFEVAIGGGEPTLYPGFSKLLKDCRSKGIVPNFTTKSLDWFKNQEFIRILPYIGSFAFSAQTPKQIKQLRTTLDFYSDLIYDIRPSRLKVNIHIVMGIHEDWQFRHLLKECFENNFTPVLLGFKSSGRGSTVKMKPYDKWMTDVQKVYEQINRNPMIGLDTVMVSEFKDTLKELNIPNYMYHGQEGTFSCYIDAINRTMAESSFSGIPSPFSYEHFEDFKESFRKLKPETKHSSKKNGKS